LAAQLMYDLVYVDKCVPKEVTGLTDAMPLYYSGEAAITRYWHGIVGSIEAYNNLVEKGEVVGKKADFKPLVLPFPYHPDGTNGNVARTTGLALFRQNPYKGDQHTENVIKFVRWLTSPVNLAVYANHEGTIPAKTSAFPYSTQMKNPELAQWAEWGRSHAWVQSWPLGHPFPGGFDAMNATLIRMLNDEISPKEAVAQITTDAERIIATWVQENPDKAKEWETPPEGWPENYLTTVGEMQKQGQ